ncbi:TetR/AcrR family transcriptional regulator [Streptomyces sp. NBC_00247]|uniref:TetR/AcrR family transcriptional regulator n=1 Tax=Streptomyces sp. NBC_00247 TaxID=2975689 RepID=UPI002E2E064B|nr:TetR/AcrR family transcriptional regulator [Streptomyces sp. NBC_00247]
MSALPSSVRRSERSRRAILEAALELCTERGYGRVTVEAIAARAGVSKKTIYRWWPAKSGILMEIFTDVLSDAAPFADTGDIEADLRVHIGLAVRLLGSPPYGPAYAGILSELHHDDELARDLAERVVDPRVELAVTLLTRAQERGQIRADADPRLMVELLYGPVYYRHVLRKPPQDEATIAALVAVVLRGPGAVAGGEPGAEAEAVAGLA